MRQRFIQSFSTSGTEHEAIDNELLGRPYVAYIRDGQYIDWDTLSPAPPVPPEPPVYSAMPLTIEAISALTITFKESTTAPTLYKSYTYSVNGGDWIETNTSANTEINLSAGDSVQFKGNNLTYASGGTGSRYCIFRVVRPSDTNFIVYGNIMSLIDSENFATLTQFPGGTYNFRCMFTGENNLKDASNLILPATSLTTGCYADMFRGCGGLVTAPELPARTLAVDSYNSLFYACTSLNSIKCLATDISARSCVYNWLLDVSQTGTFVKHPNTIWPSGTSGIPTGWTVQDYVEPNT